MKKILGLILTVFATFTLAACSNDNVEQYNDRDEMVHLDQHSIRDLLELQNDKEDKSDIDYVIYIYTDWCGFCSTMKDPMLELLDEEGYDGIFFLHRDHLFSSPDFRVEEDEENELSRDEIFEENSNTTITWLNKNNGAKQIEDLGVPMAIRIAYTEANGVVIYDFESGYTDEDLEGALRVIRTYKLDHAE